MDDAKRTIADAISFSVCRLSAAGIESPSLESQVMLCRLTGMSRTEIIAHTELELAAEQFHQFIEWMERRCNREPLPYIIGTKEFYGLDFLVTPDVLIPRPETELLAEHAISVLNDINDPTVADIGSGSGAIGICIAKLIPTSYIFAIDVSQAAIEVTRANSIRHGVDSRMDFICGDLLTPLGETKVDMIVSNPPYIPTLDIDSLEPEVSIYEPRVSLDGGIDGLDIYRRLAAESQTHLKRGGWLIVEIGESQSDLVTAIFRDSGFINVQLIDDYARIPRIVSGRMGE